MDGISGKKALVTGAAGGIGQAIVAALQSHGAVVTGADLTASKGNHSIAHCDLWVTARTILRIFCAPIRSGTTSLRPTRLTCSPGERSPVILRPT